MIISIRFAVLAMVSIVVLSGCGTTSSLHDSLRQRDYEEANKWIEKGANVNELRLEGDWAGVNKPTSSSGQGEGDTPLCYSSARYPLCNQVGYGHTASNKQQYYACYGTFEEQLNTARRLIKKGAKVNSKCSILGSPLHAATLFGNKELVRLLIESGAKVNATTALGETPLMWAYERSEIDIANLLISKGASTIAQANNGRTVKDYYDQYLVVKKQRDAELARQQQAEAERKRQEKEESRAMWKGVATLATGVAVGKATSGYSPDQQSRMMKSSMKAVDSGDASELEQTSKQVRAESAASHKTKMAEVEASKRRSSSSSGGESRAENQSSTRNSDSQNYQASATGGLSHYKERPKYRCTRTVDIGHATDWDKEKAQAAARRYSDEMESGGHNNVVILSRDMPTCVTTTAGSYYCTGHVTYEIDEPSPCGTKSGPSKGTSK